MDFVALDLEVADRANSAPCSIGLVVVKDAQIVDRKYWLINPETEFSPKSILVHRITPDMVADAPTLPYIWPDLFMLLEGENVVAHSSNYDVNVLKKAAKRYDLPFPSFSEHCTQKEAAKALSCGSCRLPDVCEYLGIPLANHHNALADAEACAHIANALFNGIISVPRGSESPPPSAKRPPDKKQIFRAAPLEYHPEMYPEEIVAGVDSPFFCATCVLTGELHISRPEAEEMIEQAGGIVRQHVSSKTDILIVGQQDKALVGEDGLSTKEEKAIALNESGKGHVLMISEKQFCAMLAKGRAFCDETKLPKSPLIEFQTNEERTYELIKACLLSVVRKNFIPEKYLSLEQRKGYWSVSCFSALIARIHFGEKARYISFDAHVGRPLLDAAGVAYTITRADPDFIRLPLQEPEGICQHLDVIAAVAQAELNHIPKDFDCCSRYEACSDALQCLQPDDALRIGCGYRSIMASGRVFYGKNKNI